MLLLMTTLLQLDYLTGTPIVLAYYLTIRAIDEMRGLKTLIEEAFIPLRV